MVGWMEKKKIKRPYGRWQDKIRREGWIKMDKEKEMDRMDSAKPSKKLSEKHKQKPSEKHKQAKA